MSPTLRSARNSPAKISSSTPRRAQSNTPRKTPHCTKCKRPRKGHSREGCPSENPGHLEDSDNTSENEGEDVADAIQSMQIDSPPPNRRSPRKQLELPLEDTKAALRQRRRSSAGLSAQLDSSPSCASISTTSESIIGRLLKPGLFDFSDTEDEVDTKGDTWKINYKPREKKPIMPGTLITPGSSFASFITEHSPPTQSFDGLPTLSSHHSIPSLATVQNVNAPRPLARSLSMEEKVQFIDMLQQLSAATACSLPLADIPELQSQAMMLNFQSRVVQGSLDGRGVLVVGREGASVLQLAEKLEASDGLCVDKPSRSGFGFSAIAGGAVVGAAATFAGLAFA